jgi:hypothetical protein
MEEQNKQKLEEGFKHFCDCINFGASFLDAEAIQFMNEFKTYLN